MTAHRFARIALMLAIGAGACKSEEAHKTAASASAPKPQSKLAQDLAAAASATASAASAGPPPGGVFGPGQADQAQPPGAPPKVTIVSAGADPKIKLAAAALPAGKLLLTVDAQAMQGQLPPVDYALEVVADKDDKSGPNKQAKAASSAAPAVGGRALALQVTSAAVDKQIGGVPENVAKIVAKLKGSVLTASVTPSDSLAGIELRLPAGAKENAKELALLGDSLVEALDLFFSPMPAEPVGQGAQWIASDRTRIAGMPLVRYRVTTLQKVAGDTVTLAIEVRQYAADENAAPPGLPEGLSLAAFDSFGKALYTRKRDDLLPLAGKMALPLKLMVGQGGAPVQGGQLASKVQAELTTPDAGGDQPKK